MNNKTWESEVPHKEKMVCCSDCGTTYCVVCHNKCPSCGSIHIGGSKYRCYEAK